MSAPSVPVIAQTAGKGAARAAARKKSKVAGSDRRPGWVTYLIIAIAVVAAMLPLYYAFLLASSNSQYIAQNPIPSPIPQGEFLDNVNRVLSSNIHFWKALSNSIIIAVVTSLSVVLFSTLAGFSFAKLRFRGRNGLLVFVIATTAVPVQLGIIPLFIVMAQLHWTGKLVAVIVPGLVTAFGVFWMTQYLEGALPYELIEATRVDGASMIRSFWHVALPAARPAAVMLGLFTFVGSWTQFFWPFIVLSSENPTLPMAVQLLQASYFKDMALIMAGVTVSIIPLLVLFFIAGRQLVAGIMQGAVKG
ncbi:carbohydrate ABC transporter permease [Cellulomonas sp. URHB0016]